MIDISNEHTRELAERWAGAHPGPAEHVDRAGVVSAFIGGLGGGAAESIRLAVAAATLGAAHATAGTTLSAVVAELDDLEGLLLEWSTRDEQWAPAADLRATATALRTLHRCGALARAAACAAYGQVVSTAARKRSRLARHDIANAIGTVRNAILLMEDEATEQSRDHFRAMAKRNSQSSEHLVRSHLSDQMALSPALGWSDFVAPRTADGAPRADLAAHVTTNVAAVDIVLQAIARLAGSAHSRESLSVTVTPISASSCVLNIPSPVRDDCPSDPEAIAAVQELASVLGLRLEAVADESALRLLIPLSARDQRDDLGGARQGHDVDAAAL